MGSAWTSSHLLAVLLAPVPWLYATIRIAFRHRRGDLSALAAVSGVALVAFVVVTVASAARILPESPGLMQRAGFVLFLGWYATASWTLLNRVPRIDRT